jgi:cytochrome c biogenesis protein CcmG/thiol:disulfide interchange protein DsbE
MTRGGPGSAPPAITRRALLKGTVTTLLAWDFLRPPLARADELRVGTTAPPAILTTVDGAQISSTELLGSVVVLTFWATWCAPCREELPMLSRYAAQHAAAGLRVLGFSLDTPDELPQVRRLAQSLRFPVGLLCQSSAPGYGRIWRLPINFTIDRAGLLVEDGWQEKKPSWTAGRLEEVVTPLLEAHR